MDTDLGPISMKIDTNIKFQNNRANFRTAEYGYFS
jgi:hypothetical protein